MGYNLTRHAVNRNKPQLDQLLEAKENFRFETTNPTKLAYKLREAVLASKKFQDLKHYYDSIFHNFKFKVEHDAVVAEYTRGPVGVAVGEDTVSDSGSNNRVVKGTIESGVNLFDVLAGALEGEKQGYVELRFPNVILKPEDKQKLFDWTKTNDWGFMDHEDKGITLSTKVEYAELYWTPDE